MARVTVEDCVKKVDDRFELVAIAAQRAKNISIGLPLTIERNDEKNTVLSLREIALGTIDVDDLRDELIKSFQKERSVEEDKVEGDPIGNDFSSSESENQPETQEESAIESTDGVSEFSFEEDNIVVDD